MKREFLGCLSINASQLIRGDGVQHHPKAEILLVAHWVEQMATLPEGQRQQPASGLEQQHRGRGRSEERPEVDVDVPGQVVHPPRRMRRDRADEQCRLQPRKVSDFVLPNAVSRTGGWRIAQRPP